MRPRHLIGVVLAGVAVVSTAALSLPGIALATSAGSDQNVTGNRAYTTVTGHTDAVTERCSRDNRQQNESSLSIHPSNGNVIAAGANDYCTIPTAGDTWEGLYRSWDGGQHWNLTLIPGYPGDESPEGKASPLHGLVAAAGDPWDAWDAHGNLYVIGIAFNRGKPQNGSAFVSTFGPDSSGKPGAKYLRTVLLATGTPAINGLFNDKTAMAVDNSGGRFDGTVYASWARFHGEKGNNNGVFVAVSRDHGRTFSHPVKVSQTIGDSQFTDVAIAPDGTATVVWRTYSDKSPHVDSIVSSRSTDGGATWTSPATIAVFTPYDKGDTYVSPAAAASASSGPDGVESDGPNAGDCGDGVLACQSGYTFYRDNSQVRVAADGAGLHVVWNQLQNPHATGSTYQPGGYSRVVYSHSSDGIHWTPPRLVDQNGAVGHQTFPTVAAGGGFVTVGWNDSRNDPCFSQERPAGNCPGGPGGTFVAPPNGSLDTFVKRLNEGTGQWDAAATRVSSRSQNPNWEQFGGRLVPFFGDYITVAFGGGKTRIDWTDNRDVPAQPGSDDGNDVLGDPNNGGSCTDITSTCFDQTRGEDQNIWIAAIGS